jgi:hypothetical protein
MDKDAPLWGRLATGGRLSIGPLANSWRMATASSAERQPPCIRNSDKIAAVMKPIARYMEESGIGVGHLAASTGLDSKLVKAIVSGNYTPSPSQRQRLAAALSVATDDISWGHSVPVQHIRGNGPQSGRST